MKSQTLIVSILVVVSLFQLVLGEAQTSCAKKRAEAERKIEDKKKVPKSTGDLIIVMPTCKADGSFAPLQCFTDSEFCLCGDDKGYPITQPKSKLRECACMIKRTNELSKVPPSQQGTIQLTTCEQNGLFTSKQCREQKCWCVDPKTGNKKGLEGGQAIKC